MQWIIDDEDFCTLISDIIRKYVLYQEAFSTIYDWWDLLNVLNEKQTKVRATNLLIEAKEVLIKGDDSVQPLIN